MYRLTMHAGTPQYKGVPSVGQLHQEASEQPFCSVDLAPLKSDLSQWCTRQLHEPVSYHTSVDMFSRCLGTYFVIYN